MEEAKKYSKDLCEMKEKLLCAAKSELERGIQNVNTHEMGDVVDMIKDLAEAEEKCWKACYYKHVVHAMEEESKEMERMGYDNWRYSSGRFAPTGHGHRSGYRPGEDIDPWMMAEGFGGDPMSTNMGYSYTGGRGGDGDGHSSRGNQNGSDSHGTSGRMGYIGSPRGDHYDRYTKARMGYHQSKDAINKERMDSSAREYVVDIAESLKEVWNDADPAMRKEIRNKMTALCNEMN